MLILSRADNDCVKIVHDVVKALRLFRLRNEHICGRIIRLSQLDFTDYAYYHEAQSQLKIFDAMAFGCHLVALLLVND